MFVGMDRFLDGKSFDEFSKDIPSGEDDASYKAFIQSLSANRYIIVKHIIIKAPGNPKGMLAKTLSKVICDSVSATSSILCILTKQGILKRTKSVEDYGGRNYRYFIDNERFIKWFKSNEV